MLLLAGFQYLSSPLVLLARVAAQKQLCPLCLAGGVVCELPLLPAPPCLVLWLEKALSVLTGISGCQCLQLQEWGVGSKGKPREHPAISTPGVEAASCPASLSSCGLFMAVRGSGVLDEKNWESVFTLSFW